MQGLVGLSFLLLFGVGYTERDSKIGKCQGGAPILSKAQPAPKQLNLKGWAMQAEPIFESRAVYASNVLDTLAIDYRSRQDLDKYWLNVDHPLRGWVDSLFAMPGVTESVEALKGAGFEILDAVSSHPVIAKHPFAKGYVFKIYPDSIQYTREGISSAEWLLRRCQIAAKIKNIIQAKRIEHFVVPEKWLYLLPFAKHHPLILIATDMEIEDAGSTRIAWKTKVTPKHLDELYCILSKGYGSIDLLSNIPYTKNEYFTFIDTENLKRDLNLHRVTKHLSKEMGRYWEKLIE